MSFCQISGRVIGELPPVGEESDWSFLVELPNGELMPVEGAFELDLKSNDVVRLYGELQDNPKVLGQKIAFVRETFPLAEQVVDTLKEYGEFVEYGVQDRDLPRPGEILANVDLSLGHVSVNRPQKQLQDESLLAWIEGMAEALELPAFNLVDPESFSFPEVGVFDLQSDQFLKLNEWDASRSAFAADITQELTDKDLKRFNLFNPKSVEVHNLNNRTQDRMFLVPYAVMDQANLLNLHKYTGLEASEFALKTRVAPTIMQKFIAAHEFAHAVSRLKHSEQGSVYKEELFADCFAYAQLRREGVAERELTKIVQYRQAALLKAPDNFNHATGEALEEFARELAGDVPASIQDVYQRAYAFAEGNGGSQVDFETKHQQIEHFSLSYQHLAGEARLTEIKKKLSEGVVPSGLVVGFEKMVDAIDAITYSEKELADPTLQQQEINAYKQALYQAVTNGLPHKNFVSCQFREEARRLEGAVESVALNQLRKEQHRLLKEVSFQMGLAETMDVGTLNLLQTPSYGVIRTGAYDSRSLEQSFSLGEEVLRQNFWQSLADVASSQQNMLRQPSVSQDQEMDLMKLSQYNYQQAFLLMHKVDNFASPEEKAAVAFAVKRPLFKEFLGPEQSQRMQERYLNNIQRQLQQRRKPAAARSTGFAR